LRWRLAAAVVVLIAIFGALYVARAVMLPIALAFVLSFLLTPVMEAFARVHVRPPLAAAFVMLVLLSTVGIGIALLAEPAADWVQRAPQVMDRLHERLSGVYEAIRKLGRLTEAVEEIAAPGGGERLQVGGAGLGGLLLSRTGQLVGSGALMLFLLFFLLASGDLFLRKLVCLLPRFREKRMAVKAARRIQHDVSRYLFTISLINTVLGTVVGLTMYALGMPNPVLWGVMAGLLNFIPYLGPAVTLTVVATVALLTFDDFATALWRPLAFFALTTVEGQLVTPLILGRRLMLNPVVIFISLIFWGWLWGVVGTLIAVPLTMSIKILCDAIPPLTPIGTLMGR
jgi:predicted PurR-regulated permease PerM